MNNDDRRALYLRDRTSLTPAQRRRVHKHDRQAVASLPRKLRRAAQREVRAADRERRYSIRRYFHLMRNSRRAA